MPENEYVVSNSSPLLNLALTSRLGLLERQFDSLHAPEQVWTELTEGTAGLQESRALRDRRNLSIEPVDETDLYVEIGRELDDPHTVGCKFMEEFATPGCRISPSSHSRQYHHQLLAGNVTRSKISKSPSNETTYSMSLSRAWIAMA
jgi:hypothetical protein